MGRFGEEKKGMDDGTRVFALTDNLAYNLPFIPDKNAGRQKNWGPAGEMERDMDTYPINSSFSLYSVFLLIFTKTLCSVSFFILKRQFSVASWSLCLDIFISL